jgi:DnaJ like chaperone protein
MSTEESLIIKSVSAGAALGSAAGRAVGGIRGVVVGAVVGGVVGGAVGVLRKFMSSPVMLLQDQPALRAIVVEHSFSALGALARADGRVSEIEVKCAHALIDEWALDDADERRAVSAFSRGRALDFAIEAEGGALKALLRREAATAERVVAALLKMITAEGLPTREGVLMLGRIARTFGLEAAFGSAPPPPIRDVLDGRDPYAVLGVARGAPVAEVRQAYRRKMSKYHPDKLSGDGLTGAALELAEQRVREVRAAFDAIEKTHTQTSPTAPK